MVDTQTDFQKRVGGLGRKHAQMANGYTTELRQDGLIVVKARQDKASRFFPLKGLALLVLGFFVFKAFMLASLGEITYNERVAKLDQGTMLEKGGAWVMQLESTTYFIAGFVEPFVD